MSKGDKVSLPDRMRAAAKVLREVDKRTLVKWGADIPRDLEELADMLEAEDRAAAEREAMVEELARDMAALFHSAGYSDHDRDRARKLIGAGWTKTAVTTDE